MNKFFKILITGVFLAGFIASAICLVCSSHNSMACCHNQAHSALPTDDSCLTHCLKQKIFAVNPENQLLGGLKEENQSFKIDLAAVKAQIIPSYFKSSLYFINKPAIKLNTGQIWFTPLLNHAPPISF